MISARGKAPLIRVRRAYGQIVEGEALVSREGFSPRYDLDRWTGLISRPGHALEGHNLKDKGIAPKAFVFGVTNPVMVQGAVFAGITITEGWSRDPYAWIHTGDIVRVDPLKKTLQLIESRR